MNACQGDREGRPYNTKLPVFHVNVYCTGDPRGRPGNHSQPSYLFSTSTCIVRATLAVALAIIRNQVACFPLRRMVANFINKYDLLACTVEILLDPRFVDAPSPAIVRFALGEGIHLFFVICSLVCFLASDYTCY